MSSAGQDSGVWAAAFTEGFVSIKGQSDCDGEGIVRVNSLCQRDRRADIESLCHPAHKPAANARSTMLAAANRFLSKLFSLSKSNLERHLLHSGTIRKIHVAMASTATATWLATGFNSRKNPMAITARFRGAGIVRNPNFNRKRISTAMPGRDFREIPCQSCARENVCEGKNRGRIKLRKHSQAGYLKFELSRK